MTKIKQHDVVLKAMIKNSEFNLCKIRFNLVIVRNTDIARIKNLAFFV